MLVYVKIYLATRGAKCSENPGREKVDNKHDKALGYKDITYLKMIGAWLNTLVTSAFDYVFTY